MSTETITVFKYAAFFDEQTEKWTYARSTFDCELDKQGVYKTVNKELVNKKYSFFFKSNLNKAWEEDGDYFVLSFDLDNKKAVKAVESKLAADIKKATKALNVATATHLKITKRLERLKAQRP